MYIILSEFYLTLRLLHYFEKNYSHLLLFLVLDGVCPESKRSQIIVTNYFYLIKYNT